MGAERVGKWAIVDSSLVKIFFVSKNWWRLCSICYRADNPVTHHVTNLKNPETLPTINPHRHRHYCHHHHHHHGHHPSLSPLQFCSSAKQKYINKRCSSTVVREFSPPHQSLKESAVSSSIAGLRSPTPACRRPAMAANTTAIMRSI